MNEPEIGDVVVSDGTGRPSEVADVVYEDDVKVVALRHEDGSESNVPLQRFTLDRYGDWTYHASRAQCEISIGRFGGEPVCVKCADDCDCLVCSR